MERVVCEENKRPKQKEHWKNSTIYQRLARIQRECWARDPGYVSKIFRTRYKLKFVAPKIEVEHFEQVERLD